MVAILEEAISASKVFVSQTGTAGIAGFVFDIANETTVELDSLITDHYVEIGTTVQDHIALAPERVTVSGFQGEYKNIVADEPSKLEKITQKLTTISSYLPALNNAANSVYNAISNNNFTNMSFGDLVSTGFDAVATVGIVGDLYKDFKNINLPQNGQEEAFIYFEALRNARQTFTIETPFRYYTDMAVESIKATQDGTTIDMSSFEITFKKIRYVRTTVTNISNSSQGRLNSQLSQTVDKGIAKGKEVVTSVLDGWGL